MPVFTAAAGIGLAASSIGLTATGVGAAVGAAGLATNVYGQVQSAEASKRAEALRARQMEANSLREQRQILRRAQAARATALARGTDAGTTAPGGSTLPGAYGQIAGETGSAIAANNENLDIGRGLFQENSRMAAAKGTAAIGAGFNNLGRDIIAVNQQIGRIGSTLFNGEEWDSSGNA
jgi:hypothetical protein